MTGGTVSGQGPSEGQENTRVFEEGTRWNHKPDALQEERIAFTLGLIPADVGTILDVGCGSGDVLTRLNLPCRAVGCDLSHRGLRQASGKVTRARAEQLPFPDASFDLVMACEVLEHLTHANEQAVCRELARVAGRYVLITVPHSENLRFMLVRCTNCSMTYHAYGHLRSYTQASLESLHLSLSTLRVVDSGHRRRVVGPTWIRFRSDVLGLYAHQPDAICPRCGKLSEEAGWMRRLTRKGLHGAARALAIRRAPAGWLGALYRPRRSS